MTARWEDFDFASEVEAAALRGPRPTNHLLLGLISLFIVLAVVWAGFTEIDEVTRGSARIIPSSQTQEIQSLEGGIVEEVLVKEGDIVQKDDILVRLDATSVSSSLGEVDAQSDALQAQIARLTAELQGDAQVSFSPTLIADAPALVSAEQRLFDSRRQALNSELSVLNQQIAQREQELAEAKRLATQHQRSATLAQEELDINLGLQQSGVVSQVEIIRLRREVNDARGQLEATRLSIPRLESAVREAEQRALDRELQYRSRISQELNERRNQLSVLNETRTGAAARVQRTDLRSPVRGIVNRVYATTIGGVIQPGTTMVDIVPLEDTLLVETRIRPQDVAFLYPGQPTKVRISAYDFAIYGGLDGQLERISADTVMDEQGNNFYRIIVRTDKNFLGDESDPLPIIPGMIAQVDILTGQKSILDYLLKPILKARTQALRER
ncbi:MAG: HlyD family type I secretion periplasmic adaptor subunit [Pseudomonadota bacterium]